MIVKLSGLFDHKTLAHSHKILLCALIRFELPQKTKFHRTQFLILSPFTATFQQHEYSKVQTNLWLFFWLLSIIIPVTTYKLWEKKQSGTKCTNCNSQTWPLDPVEVNFCSPRCPVRWLMPVKHETINYAELVCNWKLHSKTMKHLFLILIIVICTICL